MNNHAIKELRLKMQLSQEDFAHLLGVKLQTVSRWELGKNQPRFEARRKIKELIFQIQSEKERV